MLRFKCFFEEDINAYQNFKETFSTKKRVRKVTVDFFLADNSIAMNETKIANSGLPQGRFVARTKLQKPDGLFLFRVPCSEFSPFDPVISATLFKLSDH